MGTENDGYDEEAFINALWEAHDLAPESGECPQEGCDACIRCDLADFVFHITDPEIFVEHPNGNKPGHAPIGGCVGSKV